MSVWLSVSKRLSRPAGFVSCAIHISRSGLVVDPSFRRGWWLFCHTPRHLRKTMLSQDGLHKGSEVLHVVIRLLEDLIMLCFHFVSNVPVVSGVFRGLSARSFRTLAWLHPHLDVLVVTCDITLSRRLSGVLVDIRSRLHHSLVGIMTRLSNAPSSLTRSRRKLRCRCRMGRARQG